MATRDNSSEVWTVWTIIFPQVNVLILKLIQAESSLLQKLPSSFLD